MLTYPSLILSSTFILPNPSFTHLAVLYTIHRHFIFLKTFLYTHQNQEKMKGQRGRLPVQPLGYVMSTKVIFRRAKVCLLRRPHAFWKDMMNIYSSAFHVRRHFLFSLRIWERGKTVCGRLGRQTSDFRSSKNNFHGHDISRPTPWDSLSILSFSLARTWCWTPYPWIRCLLLYWPTWPRNQLLQIPQNNL